MDCDRLLFLKQRFTSTVGVPRGRRIDRRFGGSHGLVRMKGSKEAESAEIRPDPGHPRSISLSGVRDL